MKTIIQSLLVSLSLTCGSSQCADVIIDAVRTPRVALDGSEIPTVRVANSCYPRHSTVEFLNLGNGDAACFADNGITGSIIRAASWLSRHENPMRLTHFGVIILARPNWVHNTILRLMQPDEDSGQTRLSEPAGRAMLNDLRQYHGTELELVDSIATLSPFVLEASGTAGGVMRGIGPQVIIRPADLTIGEYSGEVLQREILITVPTAYTENFVEARLGTPYESIFTMPELLLATFELNRIEDTRRVFCSELGGDFYRGILRRYGARVVNQAERLHRYRNVSNLIPLQFCSMLGEDDLLFGFAGTEIPVKETVLGAYNALVAARSEAGAAHERTPLDEQAYEQRNEKSCNCLLL